MNIYLVSIFPEIFKSFLSTSLIEKAQKKKLLNFFLINPRDFCMDKHRQVDDEIYGGGKGMLMKASPVVDSVMSVVSNLEKGKKSVASLESQGQNTFKIIFLSPSKIIFNQQLAHDFAECNNLIFVCGRYEGIDHRFVEYFQKNYPTQFFIISIGKFVTLGGELPAMTMIEAITRLVPRVIKEEESWKDESYTISQDMENIEYPQYTRPEEIFGMKVPEVLLSGNHKKIDEWRKMN